MPPPGVLGRTAAFERLGADASPHVIRRRLICSSCGARGYVEVWIRTSAKGGEQTFRSLPFEGSSETIVEV